MHAESRIAGREKNEGLVEAMAARMAAQPEKFKLCKTLAEHPFGTIKRWFEYTHFLLKGLVNVRTKWSLTTLAYSISGQHGHSLICLWEKRWRATALQDAVRNTTISDIREASWTAPVLWRFASR